jgi:membrane protein implicated in regulation of membrane protease activity
MNLMLHLSLCGFLAVLLVAVYIYRHWLENHDDPYIHLHNDSHDSNIINTQTVLGKRLDMVDRVKNGLIVAVIIYAVAIAAMGVYLAWNNSGS